MDKNFQLFLSEIESVLDGRSLSLISNDTSEFQPLTPNYLTVRESSQNQSPGDLRKHEIRLRWKWRLVMARREMLSRRWLREYLPKIELEIKQLQSWDLVTVMMEDMLRPYWSMGRVYLKITLLETSFDWFLVRIRFLGREDVTSSVAVNCEYRRRGAMYWSD